MIAEWIVENRFLSENSCRNLFIVSARGWRKFFDGETTAAGLRAAQIVLHSGNQVHTHAHDGYEPRTWWRCHRHTIPTNHKWYEGKCASERLNWGTGFFASLWHGCSSVNATIWILTAAANEFFFFFYCEQICLFQMSHHEFSLHFGLLENDHDLTTTAIIVFSSLCAWAVTDWVLNGDVRVLTLKLIVCGVLVAYVHCAFICSRRILRCFSFPYRGRANASLNNRQINLVLSSQPLIWYQQKAMCTFGTWANTNTLMNCSICRHKYNGKLR